MKKYLLLVLILFCSITYAQENYKGKISLIFNKEKIELPINMVSLRKENNVIISARAELNNEKVQQLISLEWEVKKLSTSDKDLNLYNAFLLNVVNNHNGKKDEILFRMANNATDGELVVKKGTRLWNLASFALKFNIQSISFENSSIIIKGNLSLKARDKNSKTPMKPISEIKDCKFEIVI